MKTIHGGRMEEAHSVIPQIFFFKGKDGRTQEAEGWGLALLASWRVGSSGSLVQLEAGILTGGLRGALLGILFAGW